MFPKMGWIINLRKIEKKNPETDSLIVSCKVFANLKMRLQESRKYFPKP